MRALQLTLVLLGACFLEQVASHVALMEPPARNVLWRSGFSNLPKHEDDDYLLCQEDGKKCPPCGDTTDSPKPLPHQAGGEWALGIITRNYTEGETINVAVSVSNSHGGHMELKLCPNNDVKKPVKQSCLDRYPLEVVGYPDKKIPVTAPYQSKQEINVKVVLPKGVTCDQCVMQMSQYAEQFKPSNVMFRNCADIGILGSQSSGSSKSSSKSSARSQPKSSGRFGQSSDPSASVFGSLSSGQRASKSSRQSVFIDQSSGFGGPSPSNLRGPSPFTQFTSKRSPSFSQVQTPFQQQIVSSAPSSSGFAQSQQQKPSSSFGTFSGSHSAPKRLFSSNDFQHQQFQQQQQQQHQQQLQQPQHQRFPSQQPQPILHSFQSDTNLKNPSSSFSANQQFQNSRPQFQNVHQLPRPVAFSPSRIAPTPQKFETHQIASFSAPQPFSSSTQFGSQFSGQKPHISQRSTDSAIVHENRGFSGFGSSGSESAFQSHVNKPQSHGGFSSPRNFG